MNIDAAFPSKYLKASDIGDGDLPLTIKEVVIENIGQGEDVESKPILYFVETEKGLVLNKTNSNTIKGLYTAETDNWAGKMIALFATEVDFAGKQTLALRVRMKAPAPKNGNGHKPEDMRADWVDFCKRNNVTESHIRQALGTAKVSDWIGAEVGRTLEQAKQLVLEAALEF